VAIDYGILQSQIAEHGKDSATVKLMLDMLGTTLEKAETRIKNQSGKIERDRVKALNEKLALTLGHHLDEDVKIGEILKSARDWAIIAHDRLERAKTLRAEAKPISKALDQFRDGKMAELTIAGKCAQGTAFSFKVEEKDGAMIVAWTPKGTRGGGGGMPNGKCIFAFDGTLVKSGKALYLAIVGEAYNGTSTAAKVACTAAADDFDWTRVSYNPTIGSPYVHEDLQKVGAIAVDSLGEVVEEVKSTE